VHLIINDHLLAKSSDGRRQVRLVVPPNLNLKRQNHVNIPRCCGTQTPYPRLPPVDKLTTYWWPDSENLSQHTVETANNAMATTTFRLPPPSNPSLRRQNPRITAPHRATLGRMESYNSSKARLDERSHAGSPSSGDCSSARSPTVTTTRRPDSRTPGQDETFHPVCPIVLVSRMRTCVTAYSSAFFSDPCQQTRTLTHQHAPPLYRIPTPRRRHSPFPP